MSCGFYRIELMICSTSKVDRVKVHTHVVCDVLSPVSPYTCAVVLVTATDQSLACPPLAAFTNPSAYPDWPLHIPCEPVTGHVVPDVHRSN